MLIRIVLIIFLFTSCGRTKKTVNNSLKENEIISELLKSSKNQSLNMVERKKNLFSAYSKNSVQLADTIRINNLSKIAFEAYKLNYFELFKKANLDTEKLSTQLKDTFLLADVHWNYGLYYSKIEVMDSAYFHYHKALKYYEFLNNEYYTGKMLYNIAFVQGRIKDYIGSEITIFKAIKIFKKLEKYSNLYRCYKHLGIIYNNLNELDKAIIYFNNAKKYLNKIENDETFKNSILNNLGLVYQKKGDFKEAINKFETVLKGLKFKKNADEQYARALDNLTYTKFLSGDSVNVKKNLYKSLYIKTV